MRAAPFRVGLDSYCLSPLHLPPFEVVEWASEHGADGVQFTEMNVPDSWGPERWTLDRAFLADLAQAAAERKLYLEWGGAQHLPYDCRDWSARDVVTLNRIAAEQARTVGCDVIRSCSGGLMRWSDVAPPTDQLLAEMGDVLRRTEPIYRDLGVNLSIELHFEFTTFELLRLFEECGFQPGGAVGICLDTMNLLTMLEDPVEGTRRVLPWITATHVKDGALALSDDGLVSFPAEVGEGVVDLATIVALLAELPQPPNLSIEDHGGSFDLPVFDAGFRAGFPDLTADELARLLRLVRRNEPTPGLPRVVPLAREDWPAHCEARVARDLARLRSIVDSFEAAP